MGGNGTLIPSPPGFFPGPTRPWRIFDEPLQHVPRHPEQSLAFWHICDLRRLFPFLMSDPKGIADWEREIKRIRTQRQEALTKFLDKVERETGQRPQAWFTPAPLVSDEFLAAMNLHMDEPIWPCAPPGYMYYAESKKTYIGPRARTLWF